MKGKAPMGQAAVDEEQGNQPAGAEITAPDLRPVAPVQYTDLTEDERTLLSCFRATDKWGQEFALNTTIGQARRWPAEHIRRARLYLVPGPAAPAVTNIKAEV